jgi:hypothetical protein
MAIKMISGPIANSHTLSAAYTDFSGTAMGEVAGAAWNFTAAAAANISGGPMLAAAPAAGGFSFNVATGQNASGVIQTAGDQPDANWTVTNADNYQHAPTAYTVAPGEADWYSGWIANGPNSSWIAADPGTNVNGAMTFTLNFDLTGFNPADATLVGGEVAADDAAVIYLNGHEIGSTPYPGWTSFSALSSGAGDFVAGVNTLVIQITNNDNNLEGARLQGTIVDTTLSGPPPPVHWANAVNGNFTTAADWTGGVVPGADNEAILDPSGAAFTVTSSADQTVYSVQTAANATLDVTGGDFKASAGSGSGADAGVILVGSGATFTLGSGATLTDSGSIHVSGTFDVGAGTVDLSTGALSNLSSGELSGGTFLVSAGGVLQLPDNAPVTTLNASVELYGSSALIQSFDTSTSTEVSLQESLASIGAAGTLDLQGGFTWTSAGTLTNAGTLDLGGVPVGPSGLDVFTTASLVNTGLIDGYSNIYAAVTNTGTIMETTKLIGDVTNGEAGDTTALIKTYGDLELRSGGAIANFGTIVGGDFNEDGQGAVIWLEAGGTVTNLGTVTTQSATAGNAGVWLQNGGEVVNGSASDSSALILGRRFAASLTAAGTVDNWGILEGYAGPSVQFGSAGDLLIAEAGSDFIGAVDGGGGTLDLAGGAGTINGLGGAAIVTGSVSATVYGFGSYDLASGGTWTLAGADTVTAGHTLSIAGGAVDTGTLTNHGTVNQTGIVTVSGGSIVNASGGVWNLANGVAPTGGTVSFTNAGTLAKSNSALDHVGVDFANTGTVNIAAGTLDFLGPVNTFAGTVGGAGTLELGAPSAVSATTLTKGMKLTVAGLNLVGAATTVTLGGALKFAGAFTDSNATLALAGNTLRLSGSAGFGSKIGAAPAVITGPGTLTTAGATAIVGRLTLSGGALFDNLGTVTDGGAVTLADASIVNSAGAVFDIVGDQKIALAAGDTGLITNTGTLELTGAAGLSDIAVEVKSNGLIVVAGGTLEFSGEVLGVGAVQISSGTAEFDSLFGQNVSFTGASGELELHKSQLYGGTVTGFSTTGADSLDLADITFVSGSMSATYSGTATGGVLTVSDGKHTAHIHLAGDYLNSTFTLSQDASGRTMVTDPAAAAPSATPLVSAMAAFAPPAALSATSSVQAQPPPTLLATPS